MLEWAEYLKAIITIIVILDPIGLVPTFLVLAAHQHTTERKRTAFVAALSVTAVLIAATLLGYSILSVFGISIHSFRAGGGILLLLLAISMFHAHLSPSKQIPEEAIEAEKKPHIAVVPLGIPLIAGPGAISTIIIYANQSTALSHKSIIILICIGAGLLVWMTLRAAIPIGSAIGKTGANIVTRLMGLILAAVAIEFIAGGLGALFPGWMK